MNIKDQRQRISDVMAIYMVRPTEENFKFIKSDMDKRIFDNYYINFVEKVDDTALQSFFSDLISTEFSSRVYKITVTPMGFHVYHPKVFSLNINSPYSFLNSTKSKESDINNYFNKVGNGIFNVLFSLRVIPVIKYRTGWFAENIINVVQSNFKQTFDKFPELLEEFPRKNNVLLVILDRDTDLPIMLHHSASLGGMLNDVFGLDRWKTNNQNRFEIDPLTDYIWNQYLATSFVLAKEKIIDELKKISEQTDFINKSGEDVEKVTEKLSSTLEGLRDITIKQGVLNNHAKFLEKLSNEIDERRIGPLYEFEESALNKRTITRELKQKFFDLITLKSLNVKDINLSKNDLLRLAIIYYLINNKISSDEVAEIEKALKNINVCLDSLDYLKQKRQFEESMKRGQTPNESGFLQKSFSFFATKIGSLMNAEQPSIAADILTSLSNNKEVTGQNFQTMHTLKKGIEKKEYNFSTVIVFTVGGGSLAEYEYIEEVLGKSGKNVLFINF
jgi:hypothetical protein